MYKLKYFTLSKRDKNKLKETFYQTEFGQNIKKRLIRLLIIGILSIIYSIYLLITSENIWELIMGIMLLSAGLIFILGSIFIRINKLNNYLIKNKKH